MKRLRIGLVAAMLFVGFASAGLARAAESSAPLERIAMGELGGWISLEATVAGERGRWIIDTGASRNLVSPALARRLGLVPGPRVQAQTPMGAVQGTEVVLPAMSVAGDERLRQTALVIDLERVLGDAARGIDGVLGVPWLEGVRIDLDLQAWTLRVTARDESRCPPDLAPVPLSRHRALPVVALDSGERYVLDTGNPAALIRIEATPPDAATPGLALPGGLRLGVLREGAVGGHVRTAVPVLRMTSPALRRALEDAAIGLAGTAFLDGARWVIDLSGGVLCVQAGRFSTPGGFGLLPESAGGVLRIAQVLPDSPAAEAGLKAGEPIVQWAGHGATSPLQQLWSAVQGRDELMLRVGDPARVVILRRAVFAPFVD